MATSKSTNFHHTIVKKATLEQQATFLEQLFAKDADLRKQFQKFIANWEKESQKVNSPVLSFIDI